ncbi:MAG: phosphotransferase [Myxococcota bacterium]
MKFGQHAPMELARWVADAVGATSAVRVERIQSLWSGYGELVRFRLEGAPLETVVVKDVRPPSDASHPRGWNGDRSHARKLRSYDVEGNWYATYAERCTDCRVPRCFAQQHLRFALEDLDAAGFEGRGLRDGRIQGCLDWLARFHATFLGVEPEGLWPVGTYWHLETRPDEFDAMDAGPLKDAAAALDASLRCCRHSTLVHGDAKIANFLFSPSEVAAVDFQYVGGGSGIRDVAYFLGSVLGERELEHHAADWLDRYFETFAAAATRRGHDASPIEDEWRALYPIAWADFERFLAGWAPSHRKRHGYSAQMTTLALAQL